MAVRTNTTGDEDADFTAEQKFFQAIRPEIKGMLTRLQGVLISHPFCDVKDVPPSFPASLVLQRHPQYASFNRLARLLNSGLRIDADSLRIGLKNVALLYEYWCFLRLVSILADQFELQQQTMIRLRHLKTTVVISKGVEAAVTFKDRKSGKKLVLVYNRLFPHLPTIAQQPDNVLQLASEDSLFIFDAKYRVAFDANYQGAYGGVGPQVEDINVMHRYRDSIVRLDLTRTPQGYCSIIKGAIVLFPYGDEHCYKKHQFFESIEKVDIGGLPFLPGATSLVTNKIKVELVRSGFSLPPS